MRGPLVDTHGRVHRSLRLSVTDRCNFRCPYCMPATDVVFQPREEILSYEELEKLVRVGVGLGIREVRITGGEPLVRRDLPRLVRQLARIPEIQDLSLTTNGTRLVDLAGALEQAGLRRINVSLDTLSRDRFRQLCGVDALDRVLQGIEAARTAGLSPIKVNAVLMRGVNDDEVLDLVEWAREKNVSFRFIELMPIGGGPIRGKEYLVPGSEVKRRIESRYALVPKRDLDLSSPARTFSFADGRGEVGFINPITEPFCSRCDRVRITADGKIRNCLFDQGELDLRGPLRSGSSSEELGAIWRRAVRNKGPGGCVEMGGDSEPGSDRRMWQIGG
ncbi:MAG TPA: GTP 3',8-cyclase MoaA [Candidatus Polarisedimenticolia bacterium]|nr:GTP 3',8-cyclase MoaA [Candidatus Polarisedimenticolia bacterium]